MELKTIFIFCMFLLSLTLVSAQTSPYSNCEVYGNCQPVSTATNITNVNNTYTNITTYADNWSSYNAQTNVNLNNKNITNMNVLSLRNLYAFLVDSIAVSVDEIKQRTYGFIQFDNNILFANGYNYDIEDNPAPTKLIFSAMDAYTPTGELYTDGENMFINLTGNGVNGNLSISNCLKYGDGSSQCTASSGTYNSTYDTTSKDVTANRSNWEAVYNLTYQNKQNAITNNLTLRATNNYNVTMVNDGTNFAINYQTNTQGNYGNALYNVGLTGIAQNTTFKGWNETKGSLSFWVNTNSLGTVCGPAFTCNIFNNANTGGDGSIYARYFNGALTFSYRNGVSNTSSADLNTWTHYVMTWENATNRWIVYRNGALIQNNSMGGIATNYSVLNIGGMYTDTRLINGSIDEFAIWKDRVLTGAEALALYNGGIGTKISDTDANLGALYHFDEASGAALDSSGNGNNLSVTSTFTRTTGIVRQSGTSGAIVDLLNATSGVRAGESGVLYLGSDLMDLVFRGTRFKFGNSTIDFGVITAKELNATSLRGDGSNITNIGGNRNALIYQDASGLVKANNLTGLFYDDVNTILNFFGWNNLFKITDYANNINLMISKESFKSRLNITTEVFNQSTALGYGIKGAGAGGATATSFNGWNGTKGSISLWFNLSSTDCTDASNTCNIINSNTGAGDGCFYMRYIDGGGTSLTVNGQSFSTTMGAGELAHLVMTWDNITGDFKAYKNGVNISATKQAKSCAPTSITVGAMTPGSRVMSGIVDEVAIFKGKVLTQTEINNMYNAGAGWYIPNNYQNLGALYHFENNASDSSGNGNTLTVTSFTYSTTPITLPSVKKTLGLIVCEDGQIAGENGVCTWGDSNTREVWNAQNFTINSNLVVTGNIIGLQNLSVKRAYYSGYQNTTMTTDGTNVQIMNVSNNNVDSYGIYVTNQQNISFGMTGDYIIGVSPEFYQASENNKIIAFWIQKWNGTGFADVPWSNSRYSMQNGDYMAPYIPYQVDVNNTAQDIFRIAWYSDSANSQVIAVGNLSSPTRPSVPSVILNIQKVSEIT